MNDTERAAAHRFFSGDCFNRVWELMEQPERTPAEDEQMLLSTIASLWHWTQREDCTEQNRSIGCWQVSRVYALLGQADNARRFGDAALRHSQGLLPFFSAYAHEALARAAMVAGDKPLLKAHVAAATKLAESVTDSAERQLLENDLSQLRLP